MNKHIINDGRTTYTRISKTRARKAFVEGKPIVMCPVKMMPGNYPFSSSCKFFPSLENCGSLVPKTLDELFDRYNQDFIWYNCQWNEVGYYPAYYLETYKEDNGN